LIRIAPDDSWELVVGEARPVGGTLVTPISGLGDGFGNPFNAHFWRMADHAGALFVGTNDWSWLLQGSGPLISLIQPLVRRQFGYDLFGSCDGRHWYRASADAFGRSGANFGARTMESTPAGAFIGSANQAEGAIVWRITNVPPCWPKPTAIDPLVAEDLQASVSTLYRRAVLASVSCDQGSGSRGAR
jgi:hypothetical protein